MMRLSDKDVRNLAVLALTCPASAKEWSELLEASGKGEDYDKEVRVDVSIPRSAFKVLDTLITRMGSTTLKIESKEDNDISFSPTQSYILGFMVTRIFVNGLGASLNDLDAKLFEKFLALVKPDDLGLDKIGEYNHDENDDDNTKIKAGNIS